VSLHGLYALLRAWSALDEGEGSPSSALSVISGDRSPHRGEPCLRFDNSPRSASIKYGLDTNAHNPQILPTKRAQAAGTTSGSKRLASKRFEIRSCKAGAAPHFALASTADPLRSASAAGMPPIKRSMVAEAV
jgi:hypothetical protein